MERLPQCDECRMNFRTDSQLKRHKEKFCIGVTGPLEKGEDLLNLQRKSARDDIAQDRIKQLEALKQRKLRQQKIQDQEEKQLLTNLRSTSKPTVNLTRKSPDFRQIQDQINKKDIIHRRLGDLETQGRYREVERIDQLNRMVQEQEKRNQRALEDIKTELKDMIRQERQSAQAALPPPPSAPPAPLSLPPPGASQGADTVLAEVAALRTQYINGGGSDPHILAQMTEMMAEGLSLEKLKKKQRRQRRELSEPGTPGDHTAELRAIERENNRLQQQLMQLQDLQHRQLFDQGPPAFRVPPDVDSEVRRRELEHQRKMAEVQQEMELLKQQSMLAKFRKELQIESPDDLRNASPAAHPLNEVPELVQKRQVAGPFAGDPLQAAPYDPNHGFCVFLDFVLGLDKSVSGVRLVAGLYSSIQEVGEPVVFPMARTKAAPGAISTSPEKNAVVGAKQPVPRCLPNQDLSLVVEMQVVDSSSLSLKSRAWTKVDLFDARNRLQSGRFKCVMRVLPIRPQMDVSEMNLVPQYYNAVLYLRLVNARDVEAQSMVHLTPANAHLYYYPAQLPKRLESGFHGSPLPPAPVAKPGPQPPQALPAEPPPMSSRPEEELREDRASETVPRDNPLLPDNLEPPEEGPDLEGIDSERTIGFQVDRVKNGEPGIGKVRVTAYYAHSGEIVQSQSSPVTCSTSSVKSNFRVGYHVYGQQEATFQDVDVRPDMVLIVRFYLQRKGQQRYNSQEEAESEVVNLTAIEATDDVRLFDDETLVAWAAMPLVTPIRGRPAIRQGRLMVPHLKNMTVNTGTHTLPLFQPPVIDPDRIAFEPQWAPKGWHPYGKASVKLHVFHPRPRPGSLTPSPATSDDESEPPSAAWIPLERRRPCTEPFYANDGFDVYIDSCRHLPDAVTVTKVRARILTRKYEPVGKELGCMCTLDSDVFNPQYNHRQEFREPDMPPSSTLLLKIYTIDRFTQKLTLVGFSALNIFVDLGSNNQPTTDQGGVQVSLNEGAHQCRIYAEGPTGADPLSESWMRSKRIRPILGASILVRLVLAPLGNDGQPLTTDQVPKSEWRRAGLFEKKPSYSDEVYLSMSCKPSVGEARILHAHLRRPFVEMREVIPELADKKMTTIREIEKFVANELQKRFEGDYAKYNLNAISQYVPQCGFKVALDGAVNLPWQQFTLAHFCLNPPGAFYLGKPHAAYDRLIFTETLDLTSTNKGPIWQDGWHTFRHRGYHRHMCLIVHLQEVAVTATKDSYRYGLLDQAWTAVPVFENGFVFTDTFQMPLFAGAPTKSILQALTRLGLSEVMASGVEAGALKIVDGAAVIVRICDARREEELTATRDEIIYVNQDYIPRELQIKYDQNPAGFVLQSLIPKNKNKAAFVASLINKFKSLVYKLYEENKISPKIPPPPAEPAPPAKDTKDPKTDRKGEPAPPPAKK